MQQTGRAKKSPPRLRRALVYLCAQMLPNVGGHEAWIKGALPQIDAVFEECFQTAEELSSALSLSGQHGDAAIVLLPSCLLDSHHGFRRLNGIEPDFGERFRLATWAAEERDELILLDFVWASFALHLHI